MLNDIISHCRARVIMKAEGNWYIRNRRYRRYRRCI